MTKRKVEREWREPQEYEMLKAIKELKHTAPGLSGVPAALWKAISTDQKLRSVMLNIMKQCWKEERVPQTWLKYYMIVLEKKGDLTLPANYRGISIGEALSKVYTQILKHRLQDFYEEIAPEFCNGFRKGRGRCDSIFSMTETLRKRKQWGKDSWVIFFDLVRCFDKIPRAFIWRSMTQLGVSPKMIAVVKSTLHEAKCVLRVEGQERLVNMDNGTGQGTTMGADTMQSISNAHRRTLVRN